MASSPFLYLSCVSYHNSRPISPSMDAMGVGERDGSSKRLFTGQRRKAPKATIFDARSLSPLIIPLHFRLLSLVAPLSSSLSRRPSLSLPGLYLCLFAPSQPTSVCIYRARLSLGKHLRTVCSIVIATVSVCARLDDSWASPRRSCSGSLGLA